MTEQRIPYDEMVQNALLNVVREVLAETAKTGLSGAHHFYIAFRTDHPDVSVPAYLKERYKEEMTIVLQNQFWDLRVEKDFFQVGLSFNRKPAILTIPFAAVTGFLDPSVEFGLQFQRNGADAADGNGKVSPPVKKAIPKRPAADDKADADDVVTGDTTPDDSGGGDANVVTLDAFRKKK